MYLLLFQSEVVHRKLIVPVCFIEGVIHIKCIVVHSIVVPFAALVEHVHFLRRLVCVHHVQVQALVLLEEELP